MGIIKFINRVCVQTAVYWPEPQSDGFGRMQYGNPIEIKCRWDDVTEIVTNKEGEVVNSRAKLMVPDDLNENGYLFLGSLTDLTEAQKDDPLIVPKAFPIQRIDKSPLFRSTDRFVREVYL